MNKTLIVSIISILCLIQCNEFYTPRPRGWPRLEYPTATYRIHQDKTPFSFEYSSLSEINIKDNHWADIYYPNMKATIYMTYKSIENNINTLLKEVHKLTYNHTIKADGIIEQPFENNTNKVFGMMYNLKGDVASNLQFFVTDSIKHILCGSLYFYAHPNPDSIQPALDYIKKDIQHIMETFKWKYK